VAGKKHVAVEKPPEAHRPEPVVVPVPPAAPAAIEFATLDAVAPFVSTLIYNPGIACVASCYGQEYDLAEGVNDLGSAEVADFIVGGGDSQGGTMSRKGIIRIYGTGHPRAGETEALKAEAHERYDAFMGKNADNKSKKRQGRHK
jgi:hypothetical protein